MKIANYKRFQSLKSSFFLIILAIIFFHLFQILFFNRENLTERYNYKYWKERFEYSQWSLPLSKRIIGDDGLYAYLGNELVKGKDPIFISAEVPPLGKYLLGFSISIFKNSLYFPFIFGMFSLFIFFLISRKILNNNLFAVITTSFLFLDPLFFSQTTRSLLDVFQLFFLLLNVLFLLYIPDKNLKKTLFLCLITGVSLGFFSMTKFPILTPAIFLLETAYIFYKTKSKKTFIAFLIGFVIGVSIPYIRFFFLGNNIIDFLRIQKYSLNFYLISRLQSQIGAIFEGVVTGKFRELGTSNFQQIQEWTIIWPIAILSSTILSIKNLLSKESPFLKVISIFILYSLLIFSLIPFYPRYILIILPFSYLFFVILLKKFIKSDNKLKIVFLAISIFMLVNASRYLNPNKEVAVNSFVYSYSNQFFNDVWEENLSRQDKKEIDREIFRKISEKALKDARIKEIEIKKINYDFFSDTNPFVNIHILYKTEYLGGFEEIKQVKLIKEKSRYKIVWDWDYILEGFKPGFVVDSERIVGKRGTISSSNGETLVSDQLGYLISVNPREINVDKEQEMLMYLEKLSGIKAVHIQHAYLSNNLSGDYVPIFTSSKLFDGKILDSLGKFRGIKVERYPTRIYFNLDPLSSVNTFYTECCTRIYSSSNYHGKILENNPEYINESLLSGHDGGRLLFKDRNGKVIRYIINRSSRDGTDVVLPNE